LCEVGEVHEARGEPGDRRLARANTIQELGDAERGQRRRTWNLQH
jgi:hypothetical protein